MPFEKTNNEIMDIALELYLEFGDSNKELMYGRLRDMFPNLSDEYIERCYKLSCEVKENVYKIMDKLYLKEISEKAAKQQALNRYPFLNDKNYIRLYNLGVCSAWRKYGE